MSSNNVVEDMQDFLQQLSITNDPSALDDPLSSPKPSRPRIKANSTGKRSLKSTNTMRSFRTYEADDKRKVKEMEDLLRQMGKSPPVSLSKWGADKIVEGVWIGDCEAAQDREQLLQHDITHVISLLGESNLKTFPQDFSYMVIDAFDTVDYDLLSYFPKTNKFINEALSLGASGVLVHCQKGISRSSTIVTAYLMACNGMSYDSAIDLVATKRRNALPNLGFLRQLKLWERLKYQLEGNSIEHQIYQKIKLRSQMLVLRDKFLECGGKLPAPYIETFDITDITSIYLCKNCKSFLFHPNQIVDHRLQQIDLDDTSTWKTNNKSCELYFVAPMKWMGTISSMAGDIKCPNCTVTLGRWQWKEGIICGCGNTYKPSFIVSKDVTVMDSLENHPHVQRILRGSKDAADEVHSNGSGTLESPTFTRGRSASTGVSGDTSVQNKLSASSPSSAAPSPTKERSATPKLPTEDRSPSPSLSRVKIPGLSYLKKKNSGLFLSPRKALSLGGRVSGKVFGKKEEKGSPQSQVVHQEIEEIEDDIEF